MALTSSSSSCLAVGRRAGSGWMAAATSRSSGAGSPRRSGGAVRALAAIT
ncbi:hypothetical protein ACFSTC_33165 [Nonomuraea ferruginea]